MSEVVKEEPPEDAVSLLTFCLIAATVLSACVTDDMFFSWFYVQKLPMNMKMASSANP
jgi:hypothetical protein